MVCSQLIREGFPVDEEVARFSLSGLPLRYLTSSDPSSSFIHGLFPSFPSCPSFLWLLSIGVVCRQQLLSQAASPPDAEVRKDGIDASPPPCASSLASTFPGAGAPKIKIPRESLRVGSEPGDKHVGTATCRQTSISVTRQGRSHRPLT